MTTDANYIKLNSWCNRNLVLMIEVSDMMSDLLTSAEIVSSEENLSVHRPTCERQTPCMDRAQGQNAQSKMPWAPAEQQHYDMIVTGAILCQDLEMRKQNELADSSVVRL